MSLKVLQINTVYGYGSTGKIAKDIASECESRGIECKVAHRYLETEKPLPNSYQVSSYFDCHVHNRIARMTHLTGCFSRIKTARFLKKVDEYAPDIIHLHNLHGNYINVPMLFKYIKKRNIPVIWTLHDCWSFTGGCPYYDMQQCADWKRGCNNCPKQKKLVSSCTMWRKKKNWFSNVKNMLIVTPSAWLADQVGQSFLKDYPVTVINNGISLEIFKPRESDFAKRYSCEDKRIVLGVALEWEERKGIDVFLKLAKRLDENEYQIVLVGTNDEIEKVLPKNIISIHKTQDQIELAEIYTAASVFVNPTREDNFPTVNIEALACGTPVVTFKTGGSPEIIDDTCGEVVARDDFDAMRNAIIRICDGNFSREACILRAMRYERKSKFKEYVDLYENREGTNIDK